LQYSFDAYGWRNTFIGLGIFALCALLPLCAVLHRRPPAQALAAMRTSRGARRRPLGLSTTRLQSALCAAGIGCCVAMAMPQVHIIALITDLGYAAARGAEMLSLMLGCGIVSRLASGWISDHIGGLRTLLLGASLQALVLVAFVAADGLTALYVISATFGLVQGGIVPSYPIIVRAYFPAGEAGWRIGTVMLFTFIGMALGGWLAGLLYDLTGSYTVSFVNAVAFNLMNMTIVALLVRRARAGRAEAVQT
jgi:predicted MFS family arabinose efflux permease